MCGGCSHIEVKTRGPGRTLPGQRVIEFHRFLASVANPQILLLFYLSLYDFFFLSFFLFSFVFLLFLGPPPRHMEVPRVGVESEL